jgi:alpha-tubulin suppressor-like RCC1 family protein
VHATAVAAGAFFSMALDDQGRVWAWGDNGSGQLGPATSAPNSTLPIQVTGLPHIRSIAAGYDDGFAIDDAGNVWAWGGNGQGKLGVGGSSGSFPTPQQLSGLSNVTAISGYYNHTLAVTKGGTVYSWGNNDAGELGDGTHTAHATPQPVPGLANVVSVATGGYHSLALKSDGTVWAWGDNSDGRLGNGTAGSGTDSPTPVEVLEPYYYGDGALPSIIGIGAGDRTSLAIQWYSQYGT